MTFDLLWPLNTSEVQRNRKYVIETRWLIRINEESCSGKTRVLFVKQTPWNHTLDFWDPKEYTGIVMCTQTLIWPTRQWYLLTQLTPQKENTGQINMDPLDFMTCVAIQQWRWFVVISSVPNSYPVDGSSVWAHLFHSSLTIQFFQFAQMCAWVNYERACIEAVFFLVDHLYNIINALPKTNIAPKKWCLGDYFPLGKAYFQGLCWFAGGYRVAWF